MKTTMLALAFLLLPSPQARAEDLCRSLAELRGKVTYCHQNFDYYWAAKACQEEYLGVVKLEQVRIQKALDAQVKAIDNTAQNKDLEESGQVLGNTIEDLDYLIGYGKQVHTEIEDYAYDLVLPVFDDENASTDLADPAVKAEFMSRECYGDPAKQMEEMQLAIRPVVADLEKMKVAAEALEKRTGEYESGLEASTEGPVKARQWGNGAPKAVRKPAAGKKHPKSESTITGEVKNEELPSSGQPKK